MVSILYSPSQANCQKGSVGGNVAADMLEERTLWSDIQFGSRIPFPTASSDEYWVERAPLTGLECDVCEKAAVNSMEFWTDETEKKSCCACAANVTLLMDMKVKKEATRSSNGWQHWPLDCDSCARKIRGGPTKQQEIT